MSKHTQFLFSSDQEYSKYNIEQKINEIISQKNISKEEIKNKVDSFPDVGNVKLLKNSTQLLYQNDCLNKENLALIGSKENFGVSYIINGILNNLDEVKLLNRENLEWILKDALNVLYWDIAVLHSNSQLTSRNLQALKDRKISTMLSSCFNHLLLPQSPEEAIPEKFRVPIEENFLSDCSNTFFKFGVNPFIARAPAEFDSVLDSGCSLGLNNNLLLANVVVHQVSKLFGKANLPTEKPILRRINKRLDRIENLLISAIEKYSHKDAEVDDLTKNMSFSSSAINSTAMSFFSLARGERNISDSQQLQQKTSFSP